MEPVRKRLIVLGTLALLVAGGADVRRAEARPGLARLPELPRPVLSELAQTAGTDEDAEPYFPFLDGEAVDRSVSVGGTSHGLLVNGVALRESAALGILPEQRARDLRYGTEELVRLIEHTAGVLHAATGTRLWIGNLARRGGGDIAYSVSHNSGRDADLAFCYLDHRGKPADPPELVALTGQGLAVGRNLRFDAGRTWTVIKGLLSYPDAQIQYLFMASGLKNLVLAHASAAREPAWLIERAATVIRQPSDGAPHNDHLHVRIACSERDAVGGCRHTGVVHPWSNLHHASRQAAVTRFARALDSQEADQRKRAIERLALLDAREMAALVSRRLGDEAATVRAAAAQALARFGDRSAVAPLVAQHDQEGDTTVSVAIIQSVGALGGKAAGRFLARAVGEPRPDVERMLPTLTHAAAIRGPALLTLLPDTANLWLGSKAADVRGPLEDRLLHLLKQAIDPETASERGVARVVQLAAIAASATAERLEPVPALIELLSDGDGDVRASAAHALRMITNLGYGVSWAADSSAARQKGEQRWRAAYQRSKGAPRDSWLATGFIAAGYEIRQVNQKHMWELVRAVAGGDQLSFNAQCLLTRLTDHDPPIQDWAKNDACQYWLRWIKARRAGFQLEKPPAKTVRACYSAAR